MRKESSRFILNDSVLVVSAIASESQKMTRRAYLVQLLRVIRWQGAASFKLKFNWELGDFISQFYCVWEFCTFVWWFGIFPGRFRWLDERMQSESSVRRLNNENIGMTKFQFRDVKTISIFSGSILSFRESPGGSGTFSEHQLVIKSPILTTRKLNNR